MNLIIVEDYEEMSKVAAINIKNEGIRLLNTCEFEV